ncbi:hypothetical protein NliqN6_1513 [Naganishia liquefaciens]|uniref:Mediator of RNA polymerase II transcription subunit 14 n=1 Tax=Naganishia liquefaciens TaxID=104408 RepID=A0A8H3TPS5_9TREE|nr:hypothetical protein NliqN6_1513 [Naganishia liquefaciens]
MPSSLLPESEHVKHEGLEELRKALLEQLPPTDPSQVVPFGHLLDRTVKIRYEALRHLVQNRLPETQLVDRPKAIIDYAQESRMALLKLLALLRWKEQADVPKVVRTVKNEDGTTSEERQSDVQTAWRLEKLLDYQHEGVKRTREHLVHTVEGQLSALKMRNADIDTAADILVTGEYQRLPKMLDRNFNPDAVANTITAAAALRKMNETIAFRLAVRELMPPGLQLIKICDGKAYFKYLNLFECAVTVGPVDPSKQWCLADIKFLHIARQSVKGKKAEASELAQPVKQRILEMVDTALYNIMPKDNLQQDDIAPETSELSSDGAAEQKPVDMLQIVEKPLPQKRGSALFKLTNILEMLAVANQLEILIAQAMMMRRSEWQQHLQVELAADRQNLRLRYWQRQQQLPRPNERGGTSTSNQTITYGGEISLSIRSYVSEKLDVSLSQDVTENLDFSEYTRRSKIQVNWVPERSWLKIDVTDQAETEAGQDIPGIDPLNLDLEGIVLDITRRHAAMLTQGLWSVITSKIVHGDFWEAEDVKYEDEAMGPGILLKAFSERWLRLSVNSLTGELHLGEANAVVGSRLESKLAQASKIASFSPVKLMDNLLMMRSLFIRDSLEERFISMGLMTSTRLDVNPQDSEKYGLVLSSSGRQPKPILLAELPTPNSFLLLVIDNKAISYALIQLLPSLMTLGLRQKRISHCVWLDVTDFIASDDPAISAKPHRIDTRSTGFDVDPSFLHRLWIYSAARAKIQNVIDQLEAAGIQHRQESPSQSCEVPALYVQTNQMIPQANPALFHPVLKLSCLWKEVPKIQLLVRLKVRGMPDQTETDVALPSIPPPDLRYDPKRQCIVLLCDDFSIVQVARLRATAVNLQLASQVHAIASSTRAYGLRLISFTLSQVVVEFHRKASSQSASTELFLTFGFAELESLPPVLWELDGICETSLNQAMSRSDGLAEFFQEIGMSLALILAVEDIKDEMDSSMETETVQTVPLSPREYLIIWETRSRRYGITVRILDDLPKALVAYVRPTMALRVRSDLVPVIQSVAAIKPAKMQAVFQKSRSEAMEDFKQNDQQNQQNGHENPGMEAGTQSFVSLDKGLGMLVEGEWLRSFVGRTVRNLIQMALSDGP